MKADKRLLGWGDLVVYGSLALLWVVLFALPVRQSNAPLTAEISADGSIVETVDLSALSQGYSLQINGCEIVLSSDGVYVAAANCPDRFCMKTGKIKHAGESIACVPNRVVITLRQSDQTRPYDVVAY